MVGGVGAVVVFALGSLSQTSPRASALSEVALPTPVSAAPTKQATVAVGMGNIASQVTQPDRNTLFAESLVD